jgi:predicted RNase H-like HicB family nuclease
MKTQDKWSFVFSILSKPQDGMWVAHCMELDVVAVAPSMEEAEEDLESIIKAQIEYCINNNNMENLFRSAPQELWDEYLRASKKNSSKKNPLITFTTEKRLSSGATCCA